MFTLFVYISWSIVNMWTCVHCVCSFDTKSCWLMDSLILRISTLHLYGVTYMVLLRFPLSWTNGACTNSRDGGSHCSCVPKYPYYQHGDMNHCQRKSRTFVGQLPSTAFGHTTQDRLHPIHYNYTPRHEYDLLLLIIITDLMIWRIFVWDSAFVIFWNCC